MLSWIVSDIINKTYSKQCKGNTAYPNPTGIKIVFGLSPYFDIGKEAITDRERGSYYPKLEILLYGPSNYIGVYTRMYDTHGVLLSKKDSKWKCWGYHDSCWKDSVREIINTYQDQCLVIGEVFAADWYDIIEVNEEFRSELAVAKNKNQ